MTSYRDIEKKKHIQRSQLIFGSSAGRMGGTYNQIERPFCLPNEQSGTDLGTFLGFTDYKIERIEKTANNRR
jgi:hypothetical protein